MKYNVIVKEGNKIKWHMGYATQLEAQEEVRFMIAHGFEAWIEVK
jgi:hypothetical protein